MIQVITRDHAVQSIAAVLADRTHVVVGIPPTMVDTAVERLGGLAAAWFVDNGTPLVLATEQPMAAVVVAALVPVTAVALIPKTVPAADIRAALAEEYPLDGSRDIVHVRDVDEPLPVLPTLLVDAIAAVDPAAGAALHAADITNLS